MRTFNAGVAGAVAVAPITIGISRLVQRAFKEPSCRLISRLVQRAFKEPSCLQEPS
jgi:hypothetical protein